MGTLQPPSARIDDNINVKSQLINSIGSLLPIVNSGPENCIITAEHIKKYFYLAQAGVVRVDSSHLVF